MAPSTNLTQFWPRHSRWKEDYIGNRREHLLVESLIILFRQLTMQNAGIDDCMGRRMECRADRVWHIAPGGPPGGLPAATADSRQTPTLAARLMLRIPQKKTTKPCGPLTDRRARTAPCATSLAHCQTLSAWSVPPAGDDERWQTLCCTMQHILSSLCRRLQ